MSRMRTITATINYYKDIDPDTALNEWWLRQLLKSGKIPYHKSGAKYLVDLDQLEQYLANPQEQQKGESDYTPKTMRAIKCDRRYA